MGRKDIEVQDADMEHGFCGRVFLAVIQLIEGAAQITKGTVKPVPQIVDLHFDIDQGIIIERDIDIQNKGLIEGGVTGQERIFDGNGVDLLPVQIEEGTEELSQDIRIPEDDIKHVVVRHSVAYFTCSTEIRFRFGGGSTGGVDGKI